MGSRENHEEIETSGGQQTRLVPVKEPQAAEPRFTDLLGHIYEHKKCQKMPEEVVRLQQQKSNVDAQKQRS